MPRHRFRPLGAFQADGASVVAWCGVCEELIVWGLQSAAECTVCGILAHSVECKANIEERALRLNEKTSLEMGGCRVPANQPGAYCFDDGEETVDLIESSMKGAKTHGGAVNKDCRALRFAHHLVNSNVPPGAQCLVCERGFDLLSSLGIRCSRCFSSAHDTCVDLFRRTHCYPPHASLLIQDNPDIEGALAAGGVLSAKPLLVLVNSRAGGQLGARVFEDLGRLLDPHQVFDMNMEGGPAVPLEKYKHVRNLHVLVAGGDGSVGWVLGVIDKMDFRGHTKPPVGVLPLGTGNDLAKTLGWGTGYIGADLHDLADVLDEIERSTIVLLDRWSVVVTNSTDRIPRETPMTNYASCGVDAQSSLEFHELRESSPSLFPSQLINKVWYAQLGFKNIFVGVGSIERVIKDACIYVDHQRVQLPASTGGLIILNVNSYAGGADMWGPIANEQEDASRQEQQQPGEQRATSTFKAPSIGDGLLEVVTISSSLDMALNQISLLHGTRLAQGSNIAFTLVKSLPFQIDGEPKRQEPCDVEIKFRDKDRMLQSRGKSEMTYSVGNSKKSATFSEHPGTRCHDPRSHREATLEEENARLRGIIESLQGDLADARGD